MTLLKRFVLVACVSLFGLVVLAVAAVAAGGPPPSSSSSFRDLGASASSITAKGGAGFFLFVSRSDSSFQTGKETQTTQVALTVITDTGVTYDGCLVIPDSDFVVKGDLQAASLHTTLTAANSQCPGKGGVPLGASTKAGAGGTSAGGTPPGSLPLPITINVTWVGNGVVSNSHDSHSFDCLSYSTQLSASNRTAPGTAYGTVSASPGAFSAASATVTSDRSEQETNGTPPSSCFGS